MLNVLDGFARERLAVRLDRRLKSTGVVDLLSDLFVPRGVPVHARSDNGPEFVAKAVRERIAGVGAKTAFVEPGPPRENGCGESLNSKLRDEPPDGGIFQPLAEARIVVETWRRRHDAVRPRSSPGHKPPAPDASIWPTAPPEAAPAAAPKPTKRRDGNRTT